MTDARAQQEPSMEEILSSIRRIISEDGQRAPGEPAGAPPPPPERRRRPPLPRLPPQRLPPQRLRPPTRMCWS